MSFRYTAVALAFALAPAASAQKAPAPNALELGADPLLTDVYVQDGHFYDTRSNRPVAQYHLSVEVDGATPEARVRSFLAMQADAVGFVDLDDLHVRVVQKSPIGTVVRLTQTVDGVPVWGSDTVVGLDNKDRVMAFVNAIRPEAAGVATTPAVSAEAARAAALAHLGYDAATEFRVDDADLVVWPEAGNARLAWQVRLLSGGDRPGDWEVIADARTGELLRVADRFIYHGERAHSTHGAATHGDDERPAVRAPYAEAPMMAVVDASAMIFHPDPLTRAGATYGQPGYVDGGDANTPQLEAARTAVTLRDITQAGSVYRLIGPWAEIRDVEAPTNPGNYEQPAPAWNFTRDNDAFEAANVYWHIDNMMRYLNTTLGVPVRPYQYTTGVRFDPNGLNGADNSRYSRAAGDVSFGHGCVDDSEDADVIIHELGHGLHDWLTNGGLSQVNGLSEGLGDYYAASYTRALGLLPTTSPAYNWVFKWDGHNTCWNGRVTNWPNLYPGGLTGQIHTDGQIWASVLMQIWNDIGGELTDRAVSEGIRLTNGSSNQQQAAQAVLNAAFAMGYSATNINQMFARFSARGYSVTNPIPVELVAFQGEADGAAAVLRWMTASETNNAGFEVQVRAPGAEGFAVLGFVDGHGTTTEAQAYTYRAEGLAAGAYTFRLRQVDFDGQFEYTPEVEVTVGVPEGYSLSAAYPNPFNPQASFTLAVARQQQVTVALYDALGRQVRVLFSGVVPANEAQTITVDGTGLPSGIYVYRATGESFTDARQVTLLK